MDESSLRERLEALTAAHVADACVRAHVPLRAGPAGLRAAQPGCRIIGRVCPARHSGSVDVFLEAFEIAVPGDVLVVDNGGRLDEACVGDLVVREARAAGLEGIVIWGLHRDSSDIRQIGLSVFSLGSLATGPVLLNPRAADALESATVGACVVSRADFVLADDDGVLFVSANVLEQLLGIAEEIRDTERQQADLIRDGLSLRDQLRFGEYLARRRDQPSFTFREHLRSIGGSIEE